MGQLFFKLLGPPQIMRDNLPIAAFEYNKVRALLIYLVVEREVAHSREHLIGLLWPDLPERVARQNLSQALLNLLDNAVKYSGLSREILLGVHRHGNEVEIRVTDHGIGVPPAEQQRIFESFYRAPEAARETTGAGLGLALLKHFAEAHKGRAAVASGPGRGSAFSLWLPLMENDGQDSDR